jgi:hypothetical protein
MAARFSAAAKPKCNCYTDLGMATIARMHMSEPKPASRGALLTMPVSTRADALVALSMLADAEDDPTFAPNSSRAYVPFLMWSSVLTSRRFA